MNDAWGWWLFFVGLGVGVAVYWLLAGRIRRTEDDVAADEQAAEAAWISRTIVQGDGEAPPELVAQILELHRRYLDGEGPLLTPDDELGPAAYSGAGDAAGPRVDAAALPGEDAGLRRDDIRLGSDEAHMEGDDARREAPEAHLGQPG
ncbi:MAG TPA: hypothetical protein VFW92_03500 [Candidatus Limnocylindrales bacterium]|jgi:hypothetical protein|nr:hypothetical protein [Candidatus Limnocylindrales bacterium]